MVGGSRWAGSHRSAPPPPNKKKKEKKKGIGAQRLSFVCLYTGSDVIAVSGFADIRRATPSPLTLRLI